MILWVFGADHEWLLRVIACNDHTVMRWSVDLMGHLVQITNGIQAYTEPRPALVFITSAGVERNALIGDDEVARKKDIPIVQLNPGGTLNYKYAGEWAIRTAELPYTVIRSTGD